MLSPEMQSRLAELRQKSRDNTITKEELQEAMAAMRQERVGASVTSATAKAKKSTTAAKKNIDSDDLLADLENF